MENKKIPCTNDVIIDETLDKIIKTYIRVR